MVRDYFFESNEFCLQDYQKDDRVGWNLYLCKQLEILQKEISYICM